MFFWKEEEDLPHKRKILFLQMKSIFFQSSRGTRFSVGRRFFSSRLLGAEYLLLQEDEANFLLLEAEGVHLPPEDEDELLLCLTE